MRNWTVRNQASRDRQAGANCHDKKAGPRLRKKMRRIHHDRAELITPAGERAPDSCKVLAFMRGEGAADIFEHDHARWSTFCVQGLINFQKGQNVPDRSPLRPSPAPARERS
jgi:hypothetical protein